MNHLCDKTATSNRMSLCCDENQFGGGDGGGGRPPKVRTNVKTLVKSQAVAQVVEPHYIYTRFQRILGLLTTFFTCGQFSNGFPPWRWRIFFSFSLSFISIAAVGTQTIYKQRRYRQQLNNGDFMRIVYVPGGLWTQWSRSHTNGFWNQITNMHCTQTVGQVKFVFVFFFCCYWIQFKEHRLHFFFFCTWIDIPHNFCVEFCYTLAASDWRKSYEKNKQIFFANSAGCQFKLVKIGFTYYFVFLFRIITA